MTKQKKLTKISFDISREEISDETENNDNVEQNLQTEHNKEDFNNSSNSVEKIFEQCLKILLFGVVILIFVIICLAILAVVC